MKKRNNKIFIKQALPSACNDNLLAKKILPHEEEVTRKKVQELKFEIASCQDSIKRLFAFASGEKSLLIKRSSANLQKYQRTEKDDRLLLKTVAYLREKIERMKQEIKYLRGK